MRGAIIGIVMLVAGAAIGWIAAPALHESTPPAPEVKAAAPIEIVAGNDEIDRITAERDRLEEENDELVAQVTQLLDQQGEWLAAAGLVEPEEAAAALTPEQERDRGRRGPPDWDSEEMRARREEFMRENARRMQEFEDRIAAQITDPAAIEAYNALMELRDYQEQLRDQLRDAQTDAEREAIRAKMDESRRDAREMVKDQQDAMLRSIAKANGITDPKKQTAFVSAMRDTLGNPFFEMDDMLTGGGRPGRGGFPTGGGRSSRGSGGRPPGQFQSGEQN